MSVVQIYRRAFLLYKESFVRLITVVAIVQVPLMLLDILIQWTIGSGHSSHTMTIGGEILLVATSDIIYAIGLGALTKTISENCLSNSLSIGETYRAIAPRIATLILATLVVGILVSVGFILLIVPGVILWLQYALILPVVVQENQTAFGAMKRSKALVSGNLGKVFLVCLMALLIVLIAHWVACYFGGVISPGTVVASGNPDTPVQVVPSFISQLFAIMGDVLVAPISAAAFVLLYYDLRIRKEGFNMEMLAKGIVKASAVPAGQTPPAIPPSDPQV